MNHRFAPTALMLGNFVTGMSVLAPIGMLNELSSDLHVAVSDAGLLITFGAIALAIGSPVTAWLTSRIDRRLLLSVTMLVAAICNLASAFAPSYGVLLLTRIVMLAIVALFTPQAAATSALISPPERRGSTMTYVFMGWSISVAIGLPAITYIASHLGWRESYGCIAAIALISSVFVAWRLPHGLLGARVELKTWSELAHNPLVLILLAVTALQLGGQQLVLTFLAPLTKRFATAETVAFLFATYGVASLVGNIIASRLVDNWGVWKTSLAFTLSIFFGIAVWTLSTGIIPALFAGIALWGFGFAAVNSMQQVRLVSAAPALSSASVSLNTSMIYLGQGVGSAVSSMLYVRNLYAEMNYVSLVFLLIAIALIIGTRPRKDTA